MKMKLVMDGDHFIKSDNRTIYRVCSAMYVVGYRDVWSWWSYGVCLSLRRIFFCWRRWNRSVIFTLQLKIIRKWIWRFSDSENQDFKASLSFNGQKVVLIQVQKMTEWICRILFAFNKFWENKKRFFTWNTLSKNFVCNKYLSPEQKSYFTDNYFYSAFNFNCFFIYFTLFIYC